MPAPHGGRYLFAWTATERVRTAHVVILAVLLLLMTAVVFATHAVLTHLLQPLRALRDASDAGIQGDGPDAHPSGPEIPERSPPGRRRKHSQGPRAGARRRDKNGCGRSRNDDGREHEATVDLIPALESRKAKARRVFTLCKHEGFERLVLVIDCNSGVMKSEPTAADWIPGLEHALLRPEQQQVPWHSRIAAPQPVSLVRQRYGPSYVVAEHPSAFGVEAKAASVTTARHGCRPAAVAMRDAAADSGGPNRFARRASVNRAAIDAEQGERMARARAPGRKVSATSFGDGPEQSFFFRLERRPRRFGHADDRDVWREQRGQIDGAHLAPAFAVRRVSRNAVFERPAGRIAPVGSNSPPVSFSVTQEFTRRSFQPPNRLIGTGRARGIL